VSSQRIGEIQGVGSVPDNVACFTNFCQISQLGASGLCLWVCRCRELRARWCAPLRQTRRGDPGILRRLPGRLPRRRPRSPGREEGCPLDGLFRRALSRGGGLMRGIEDRAQGFIGGTFAQDAAPSKDPHCLGIRKPLPQSGEPSEAV